MKIYKYWVTEKQKILLEGVEQEITCYDGSNSSTAEARLRAREKAEKIPRKIKGERHLFDEYEAEIREEILQIIGDHSAITRNRYGAQILNAENLLILDIDKPKSSFGDMFKRKDAASDKPYRMKMQAYKVRFPGNRDDHEFQQWLTKYESESRNFSVCQLVEQLGAGHALNDVIRLHDEMTGINYRQSLA